MSFRRAQIIWKYGGRGDVGEIIIFYVKANYFWQHYNILTMPRASNDQPSAIVRGGRICDHSYKLSIGGRASHEKLIIYPLGIGEKARVRGIAACNHA